MSLSPFFEHLAMSFLADKNNGFVTFFIKSKVLHEMIKDVINQGGDPPKKQIT